jgi:hypothetical protein
MTYSYTAINTGTAPNSGDGSTISDAFTTVNSNFSNVATAINSTLKVVSPNYITVSSTTTYSLSSTASDNILLVTSSGLTATINMPASPVNGQVATISANAAVTLSVGTGTVQPTFAGSYTTTSATYRYIYNSSAATWYRN